MASLPNPFDEELAKLADQIAAVQGALRVALTGILNDDAGARAFGRSFGLTRSLGWSLWNLAFAPDVPAALRALPGEKGWKLFFDGLRRRGCTPERLGALQAATAVLLAELKSRSLQPTLLRSIASGVLDTADEIRQMHRARRRAREAAEVIYGVRSTSIWSALIAGEPDDEQCVDTAGVTCFDGLERLRPGPGWPIFEGQVHEGNPNASVKPLEASEIGWAVDRLCTPGSVGVALQQSYALGHLVTFVDVGASAHGNRARKAIASSHRSVRGIRAAFGQLSLRSGRITPAQTGGSPQPMHLGMIFSVPTSVATFEILLHRKIPMHAEPSAALYGPPDAWPDATGGHGVPSRLESKRLPLDAAVEVLTADEDSVITPKAKRAKTRRAAESMSGPSAAQSTNQEILSVAFASLGASIADFRRFRITVKDPPMHGRVILRWLP
jgi:hypothetical protein